MGKAKYKEWLEEDGLLRIAAWARDGLTDEQIAENIGINRQTLYTWKKKYSDIHDALKKSKELADIQVENATYESAKGYFVEEIKTTTIEKADGGTETKTEINKKWIPPNPALNIFWLKNRKPSIWRDKQPEAPDENEGNSIKNWIKATSGKAEEGLFDEHEEDEE